MKSEAVLAALSLSLALFISGCSSDKRIAPPMDTGFFEDYSKLEVKPQIKPKSYSKILVAQAEVVPGIAEIKQTESQKKMYKEISEYLTSEYKKIVQANSHYTLSDAKAEGTLILESAISTVEVHFDDKKWSQFTPIEMGLDTISFNAYMYEFVRVLGESRLVDAKSGEVISISREIQKNHKIAISGDDLVFKDVKPALDSWLGQVKEKLSSK